MVVVVVVTFFRGGRGGNHFMFVYLGDPIFLPDPNFVEMVEMRITNWLTKEFSYGIFLILIWQPFLCLGPPTQPL